MHHVWVTHIVPDFALWQTTANGKQRPSHIHTGRAMHILESACMEERPTSLAEVCQAFRAQVARAHVLYGSDLHCGTLKGNVFL
jgi:hypothetical protein